MHIHMKKHLAETEERPTVQAVVPTSRPVNEIEEGEVVDSEEELSAESDTSDEEIFKPKSNSKFSKLSKDKKEVVENHCKIPLTSLEINKRLPMLRDSNGTAH